MKYTDYIDDVKRLIDLTVIVHDGVELPYDEGIEKLICTFRAVKRMHGQVFFAGNGGSAAIAEHMTADYLKNGHMRTVSLYDSSVVTCLGNDYGYEYVFSKQLEMMADKGDILVAISSSGNSENIVNAIDAIHRREGNVITLTGLDSRNKVRAAGDINVYVPCNEYGKVESIHNFILQQLIDEMKANEVQQ